MNYEKILELNNKKYNHNIEDEIYTKDEIIDELWNEFCQDMNPESSWFWEYIDIDKLLDDLCVQLFKDVYTYKSYFDEWENIYEN